MEGKRRKTADKRHRRRQVARLIETLMTAAVNCIYPPFFFPFFCSVIRLFLGRKKELRPTVRWRGRWWVPDTQSPFKKYIFLMTLRGFAERLFFFFSFFFNESLMEEENWRKKRRRNLIAASWAMNDELVQHGTARHRTAQQQVGAYFSTAWKCSSERKTEPRFCLRSRGLKVRLFLFFFLFCPVVKKY